MTVLLVVAFFAVVQSFFGIGLLAFGTPTLLLLGHPFAETLATLLPPSLAISLLQVAAGPRLPAAMLTRIGLWCLLPLASTLALVLVLKLDASLGLVVAITLIVFAGLRLTPALLRHLKSWVQRHQRACLLLTGVVHGASNLGGGLLTILSASLHDDKATIRTFVAVAYLCFAAVQLAVLAVLRPETFNTEQLLYAGIAAAVFLTIGEWLFRSVSPPAFDRIFSLFMAAYGTVLLIKSLRVYW